MIRSIVDSGVDIDKLSYVPGDSRATGVPFGLGVDRHALLSAADICNQSETEGAPAWHLCFEPWAQSAVESLLLARYWNFKRIYWHHTNRALGAMVSHVLRTLIDSQKLTLDKYVEDTIGHSDIQALGYLDRLHKDAFGSHSILAGLESRRAGLFKRLVSIRLPSNVEGSKSPEIARREKIYSALKSFDDAKRSQVGQRLSERLKVVFPSVSSPAIVLVDFPGRELDQQIGQVCIGKPELNGRVLLKEVSPFISILTKQFGELTRTVRFFVEPTVRDELGKEAIAKEVEALEIELASVVDNLRTVKTSTIN